MAEAALDHATVEELRRISRAESQREPGVVERLVAVPRPRERPGEHVVPVDGGPLLLSEPRERERSPEPDPVVDVEERDLEVDVHAPCALEPGDRGNELVLTRGGGAAEEVAVRRDVLRQREDLR